MPVTVGGIAIPFVNSCKNLGLIFDSNLNWKENTVSLARKSFVKLKSLYRFRKFLSESVKLRLVEALILSGLDYGDLIYDSMDISLANQIQKIQNSCIRFACNIRKKRSYNPCVK